MESSAAQNCDQSGIQFQKMLDGEGVPVGRSKFALIASEDAQRLPFSLSVTFWVKNWQEKKKVSDKSTL